MSSQKRADSSAAAGPCSQGVHAQTLKCATSLSRPEIQAHQPRCALSDGRCCRRRSAGSRRPAAAGGVGQTSGSRASGGPSTTGHPSAAAAAQAAHPRAAPAAACLGATPFSFRTCWHLHGLTLPVVSSCLCPVGAAATKHFSSFAGCPAAKHCGAALANRLFLWKSACCWSLRRLVACGPGAVGRCAGRPCTWRP